MLKSETVSYDRLFAHRPTSKYPAQRTHLRSERGFHCSSFKDWMLYILNWQKPFFFQIMTDLLVYTLSTQVSMSKYLWSRQYLTQCNNVKENSYTFNLDFSVKIVFFPLRTDPFLEEMQCAGEKTGSHKSCIFCKNFSKLSNLLKCCQKLQAKRGIDIHGKVS